MSDREPVADLGAEAAREWAESRKGWELVSYRLIGLPYWRVRTRLRVLDRKEVGPIDEYLLRSIGLGVDHAEDLGELLGLDGPALDAHLVCSRGKRSRASPADCSSPRRVATSSPRPDV